MKNASMNCVCQKENWHFLFMGKGAEASLFHRPRHAILRRLAGSTYEGMHDARHARP
jgi:hypothetical protein